MVLRQTPRAVMPFGGLSVFIEFLAKVGFREPVRVDLPDIRGGARAASGKKAFAGPEVVRSSGLHLSSVRDLPARPAGGDLVRAGAIKLALMK